MHIIHSEYLTNDYLLFAKSRNILHKIIMLQLRIRMRAGAAIYVDVAG